MDHEWAVGDLEQQLCEAESEIESLREQLDTARAVYKYMCEEIQKLRALLGKTKMDLSYTEAAKVLKKIEAEPDKEEQILKDIEDDTATIIQNYEYGIDWYEFYDGSLLINMSQNKWVVDAKPDWRG